ncbi:MAG: cytochrome c-type biogenesis CcmF C-terminal domain-containing protein [Tepidisphaeraceae bacterium]|jgi:cytochrome c-type biogenesis protein CcmF
MNTLGEMALSFAVLASAVAILASIVSARFQSARALGVARWSIAVLAVMLCASAAVLLVALLGGEFSFDYVAKFTDRALPTGYKLAAFWAGQEGSLLLWAVLLAVLSTIAVFTLSRQQPISQSAATIATLSVVCAFFALLILFAANPFALSPENPDDGNGLNPMLQDWAMIAHPPLLFLGYAGFTIPFALMVGALLVGRQDDLWIDATRRWVLFAWLFLTVGIVLGAQWAYVELGWGGYWAWDPVENASLLPWLTGTAFIHSLMVQQHRGMFRIWNAALLAVTFVLCIFGTYLTRSGIVDSVHGFGESLIGTFFLAFLLAVVVFSVGLMIWRMRRLRSQRKLEGLIGRDGAFLATNVLLSGMTLVVLIGTVFPVISRVFTGTSTTLGPPFYNKVVAPAALLLVGLMAIGPLLTYGKEAARRLARGIFIPALAATVAGVAVWVRGFHSAWAVACAAIAAAAVTAALIDFTRMLIARCRDENPLLALFRLIDGNHRRYGGQLVHMGILLVVIGVTGSSVFSVNQTFQLNPGHWTAFAGFKLTLNSIAQSRGVNYQMTEANVTATDANGRSFTLKPQRRVYDKWEEQTSSVVAIGSNWKRDLYLNLAGWDEGGQNVAIQAIVNPLVNWIWAGGWVLAIGALICLIPRIESLFAKAPAFQLAPAVRQPAPKPRGRRSHNPGPAVAAR